MSAAPTDVEAPRRGPVLRWLPYLALAAVVVAALAIGGSRRPAKNLTERTQEIAASIRCPSCADESMATSNSLTSVAGRAEIARRLRAGESSAQIRAYFAGTYGDRILLTPKRTGVDALVWIVPVVAFVVGAAGLTAAFLRWRRLATAGPSPADLDLVERARQEQRADEEDPDAGGGDGSDETGA